LKCGSGGAGTGFAAQLLGEQPAALQQLFCVGRQRSTAWARTSFSRPNWLSTWSVTGVSSLSLIA